MPEIRVALQGFGRIGRNLFRQLYKSEDLRIVAICDPAEPEALEYLLRFDTLLGRFPDEIRLAEDRLFVWGRPVRMLREEPSATAPWEELGVDIVIEATGRPRSRTELEKHLSAGARRVVLCSPPIEPPDLTVIRGINDDALEPAHRIVSNASCTAYAIAPVLQSLDVAFGIEQAFLSSVHAYTNQQRLADVPLKDKRRGRAAVENIIPQQSGAPALLAELLPTLRGRLDGAAMNVPVPDGSVVDLVCWHREPVTRDSLNEVLRSAAASRWSEILDWTDEPIVSSDILLSPFSGTVDGDATAVLGDRISKTLTWYDNGWAYASRAIELVRQLAALEEPE
jgi:glyceraldehyde 3-phosphate dehydrogenase